MALMTSMRERMHVVLWALLALFLLSMTVGGLVGGANIIDQLIGKTNPQTTIAKINGEIISPSQFNSLVNQQLTSLKSNGQSVNDFQINQARNRAWDNMLQDILVSQEVEKLGIKASNKEVMYHLENQPPTFLQQNPTFQTEGKFDLNKYLNALANPNGDEWVPIEQFMKNTYIPNFKLQKLIDESIVISKDEVMAEFKNRNLDYTITALHVTSALVSKEDSKPTQDEIIERSNSTEYGLVAYLYTEDVRKGLRLSEKLEFGMIGLNRGLVSDPAAPFGGVKQSGLGREGGKEGLLEFQETQYISTEW